MSGMLVMTGLTVSLPKSIVFPRDFVSAISLDMFLLDLQIWTDFAPSQNFPKNAGNISLAMNFGWALRSYTTWNLTWAGGDQVAQVCPG